MSKYYAGIGSRETPPGVCKAMTNLAYELSEAGYILRSGGADGADLAFEGGAGPEAEIYLPWEGFNGNSSPLVVGDAPLLRFVAQKLHPAWDRCKSGAKRMHTRNVAQVLGTQPESPKSDFVVCWTKDGKGGGGTGQAIRVARAFGVEVYDLALPDEMCRLRAHAL